jgi:hypothetical protein
MKTAPAEIVEMVNRVAAQDAAHKLELVTFLGTAQKSYTTEELNAKDIPELEKLADLVGMNAPTPVAALVGTRKVDFSARNPLPRAAAAPSNVVPDAWGTHLAGKDGK